ncbi:hypothetical protein [Microlunatus parietis]|uniref:Uncharacterized protein n=1 Tax=Microlunatus parietis TaxID=682979 RepID=A0A7Y9I399_9ACTN|nr:hypothetical protein [Microlunatus parietis]NYE69342.1 hypothetical protein [Microlunatus parietis]
MNADLRRHPRRNRVTPAGEFIATEHRGAWYGNRGVLHNEQLDLVRRHQGRRWIICVLRFKDRRRPLLRPDRFTELFFLDEAGALAAGHRPCAECRYADYQRFRTAWAAGHGLGSLPSADELDRALHPQRILHDGLRLLHPAPLDSLPDGVFVQWRDAPWVWAGGRLWRWTPGGYDQRRDPFDGPADVLTPLSTVAAIRAGYRPQLHESVRG